MTRLQSIEHKLVEINETVFQELCDCYLILRNQDYRAFSRTGSMIGKQKTKQGTPDSFFLLQNGNYLFVEVTTNKSDKQKLEKDIKACFNHRKTKIAYNKIEEIILCFNWNIDQNDIAKLDSLVKEFNPYAKVSFVMLSELALDLHLKYKHLVHEYLGLPLDTGQIVSIERFIEEYGKASNGIATPLNNTFLHREIELQELKQSMILNDFIILTGAPGIGKTKLALEGIKIFLTENMTYGAYCISYKSHTLLDDLYQYLKTEKDYILFVDDANRIDAFNQITQFYKVPRKGKLKLLITVRDYAFQEIRILCHEFSPKRIDLLKLSDQQITNIIKSKPFEILPYFHKQIIQIADGNPRIAVMAALLAKTEMDIYALEDVSELFENYFITFEADEGSFAKKINIKCLGLISFFYTIPYKNQELTSSILDKFGIEYSTFIDAIDKLDKLEMVERQFEYVKIPEQNLSSFFFYKAFIKDNLLSFGTLLNEYFESNTIRFKDSVIPANNTFGHSKVMDKLKPFLQNYWRTNKSDNEKAFKFLSIFWFYLQDETLEYVYSITQSLPITKTDNYNVTYKKNIFSSCKNVVLELIGNFFRYQYNLKNALLIAFEYTRRSPEHLPELIHKIKKSLCFDLDDEPINFSRQYILFEILISGLNENDNLKASAFYELSKVFLGFNFHHAKSVKKMSFYMYHYSVPNIESIQNFRKNIWDTIQANFLLYPENSLELLQSYSLVHSDVSKDMMQFDVPILVEIIEKQLSPNSFEHCKYVQDQIRWCERNAVSHSSFSELLSKFRNSTYEKFLKIEWDIFRDKESYQYDDFKHYELLKETDIRNSFIFNDKEQVEVFYNTFVYLKKFSKSNYFYNKSLDHIIDANFSKEFQIGKELLKCVIQNNNEINFVPQVIFRNRLKEQKNSEILWELIEQNTFFQKTLWQFSFFDYLDDSLLTTQYVQLLTGTVIGMKEPYTIHFDRLNRFLSIEPNLFHIILKNIVEKNERDGTKVQVWRGFFSENFDNFGNDIELIKKAFIQQDKIDNDLDYEGKGMLKILNSDSNFLLEYVSSFFHNNKFVISGDRKRLEFVWQIEGIEKVLIKVFDLIIEIEPYWGIGDHFCNSFFRNLQGEQKEKASRFLLDFVRNNYTVEGKMNIVVDISRHSMYELFDDIILLFLTLTQDINIFAKISWRGNGGTYSGDVNIGDIEATDWRNILSVVDRSDLGINMIPIKHYINEQISHSLKRADLERQTRFLERF